MNQSLDHELKPYSEPPFSIQASDTGGILSTTWVVVDASGEDITEFGWHQDALFFAAAPDLFKQAKLCLSVVTKLFNLYGEAIEESGDEELLQAIRDLINGSDAAIRKARGDM